MQHPQPWLLSVGSVLLCSRWGYRQTFHSSFPSVVRLSLSITDAGAVLVPSGSTTEVGWRCTRGRPDGILDLFLIPCHQDLCLISPCPLMLLRVEQSSFPGMFPKLGLLGEASISHVPVHHELQPPRLLRPWGFPGKITGVGCHFLLQGIFLTQRLNRVSLIAGRRLTL